MQIHASVFKAYDIRGVVGQTIDEAFAEHLGRAFGTEALAEMVLEAYRRAKAAAADDRAQLRAILRASAHGKVRLLIPMIAHLSEIRSTLEALRWRTEASTPATSTGLSEVVKMKPGA